MIGVGTLGALTLVLARLYAPAAIVAYGVREAELELARRLGATETVDVSGGTAAHEGELDLVVETAGAVPRSSWRRGCRARAGESSRSASPAPAAS